MFDMTLSEELQWRGFVNQTTYSDLTKLDKSPKITFYHGFDASADSQTIGNLAAMMFDKVFMRHGHKAILLAGGSTSLIGDPGGKNEERPLQNETTIAHNVKRAEEQIKKVMSGHDFILVNNLDWTKDLKVLPFLRDIGKHFSMTPLIQRDYISKRIGEDGGGISYAEFSYTILQGYDYLHLYDKYNAILQLGGSDQWGNCLSGVELIRKARGKDVNVITLPLIIDKSTGQKFGKSEAGAIWLDPAKTSPHDFYQFWINVGDDSVGDYLKIFTELDKAQIAKIMTEFEKDKPGRLAQKTLAYEVTKLVHGQAAAESEKSNANQKIFGTTHKVAADASVVSVLVETGLASSNSEARQLIAGGGVYINDKQSSRDNIEGSDFIDGVLRLRKGKTLQNTRILKKK